MNRLSTARKTISLFLAFILTAGTITVFFPSLSSSFLTEVRALSDYEMMMMMGEYKSKILPYKKMNSFLKCCLHNN